MVEVTAFTMMALFISRQGVVAAASHQIATSLATVLYMVPLSLGIASSARVGFWMGAQQTRFAEQAAPGEEQRVALLGRQPALASQLIRQVEQALLALTSRQVVLFQQSEDQCLVT